MSRPCHFFNTPSGCRKGSQCPFVHSSTTRPVQSPTPDNVAPPQSAMSRAPCRFFNTPSGCGKGSQCPFVHSSPNDTTRPVRSPTPGNVAPPQSANRPSGNGNSPPGVCKYFWDTGKCKREFSCRYKHTQQAGRTTPPPAPSPSATAQSTSESVLKRVAPFLTEQGLSKMSGSGTDGFFAQDDSLSPSEAHNTLKRYLSDYFRFKTTFEVYAFLRPLNSATASNAGWVRHAVFVVPAHVLTHLPGRRRWSSKS